MKTILTIITLVIALGCGSEDSTKDNTTTPPTNTTIQGLKSLYMGHSYFRRQAEAMEEYAEIAGIEGHESTFSSSWRAQRVSRRHLE